MPRELIETGQVLAILRETPHRLGEVTRGASDAVLGAQPEPGGWSPVEILAHLRSCADVWGDAIDTTLAGDHPTIRAVNPTTWIDSTDYRDLEFGVSLEAFTRQRERLLGVLGPLRDEDWSRGATVVGGGAPIERTVHTYASRFARHERSHWRPFEKTLRLLGA